MSEPVVRAHLFHGFDGFASRKGFDFDAILKDVGLTRAELADPAGEISLNMAAEVLTLAAEKARDPCLGLHWAEAFPEGGSGVIGYLMLNARTLRVAAKAIARCTPLHVDPVETEFKEIEGSGRLEWRFPITFSAPRIQYASFIAAVMVLRLRRLVGPSWMPMGVELEHRELPCKETVARIFGPNVRYDSPVNAIEIREETLDRTSRTADTKLFEIVHELAERQLRDRRKKSNIVDKTRCAIADSVETGDVTLDDIARQLELSPRTLQSRLASAGTNFEEQLHDTRRELADMYMRDTDLTLTEIALLLGFSELSAFTRAANKWYGTPPSQRRTALLKSAARGTLRI